MLHRTGFRIAVVLAAFLLFLAEPMAGKELLPRFGGAAAVWIACLVWFQVALLAGYGYAHFLARRQGRALAVHAGLLLGGMAGAAWWSLGESARAETSATPALAVCLALTRSIGLPFLLLATTGPLMQAWWERVEGRGVPFRLFGLSNFASLLALLLYPTVVEPSLTLHAQRLVWAVGVALFAATSGVLCWRVSQCAGPPHMASETLPDPRRAGRSEHALWFLLPMGGTVDRRHQLSHQQRCTHAAALGAPAGGVSAVVRGFVPGPLALPPPGDDAAASGVRRGAGVSTRAPGDRASAPLEYGTASAGASVCLLVSACGARRLAPTGCPRGHHVLPSVGGWRSGGFFPLGHRGAAGLPRHLRPRTGIAADGSSGRCRGVARRLGPACALGRRSRIAGGAGCDPARTVLRGVLVATRNFYGGLRVRQSLTAAGDPERTLMSGSIDHGTQIFSDALRQVPTTYYAQDSGVGIALTECCAGRPKRVGVVGLGAGTLAAYGETGDQMRFYEINPAVEPLARHLFSYLRESSAAITIVDGDGRAMLAREAPGSFDVIAVDAFTGDAIPVHLLTTEAMAVYRRDLAPNGVLAFHVSNQFVDLAPEVDALAHAAGMEARLIESPANPARGELKAEWVLMTARPDFFSEPGLRERAQTIVPRAGVKAWTDDSSSLWRVLRW